MKRKAVVFLLLGTLMLGGCGSGNESGESEDTSESTVITESENCSEKLVTTRYE